MEGHIVGTGVWVPSPLQAREYFGKAGAWRPHVDKAAQRQSDGKVFYCRCGCNYTVSPLKALPSLSL